MSRSINHIERISESFETLDSMSRADIVYELFSRLDDVAKAEALRRITNHAKMAGLARPEPRRNGTPIPALMDRKEVEAAGKLALEPTSEVKQ